MADAYKNEDGTGGLQVVCQDAFDAMSQAASDYDTKLAPIKDTINENLKSIDKTGFTPLATTVKGLLTDQTALFDLYKNRISDLTTLNNKLSEITKNYKDQQLALEAIEKSYNKLQEIRGDAADDAADEMGGNSGKDDKPDKNQQPQTPTKPTAPKSNGNDTQKVLPVGTIVRIKKGEKYYKDSLGNDPTTPYFGYDIDYKVGKQTLKNNTTAPYPIHLVDPETNAKRGWLRKNQLVGYNTGGYTGE